MIEMFDHVLVDEYQDVNALQVEIVRALRPDGRGLTVVGDDAQAIYGFRGADARYLHDLAGSLPGATVIALERNFRSVQPILNLANLVRPREAGVRLVLQRAKGPGAAGRSSSAATTPRARPVPSSTGSSTPTTRACGCATRPCSCAPPTTATSSSSSSRPGGSPTASTGASASWRRRT